MNTPEDRMSVDEFDLLWPNCSVPDCCNKICRHVSDSLCAPHYFGLPMDSKGGAVFPDEETREAVREEIRLARDRHQDSPEESEV